MMRDGGGTGVFELWFRCIDKGRYGAQLVRAGSHAGTMVDFTIPFENEELASMRERAEGRLPEPEAKGMAFMEGVGETLFHTLFHGQMLTALRCSRAALGRGAILRITLDFTQAPKLAELPWEYLFDAEEREFLLAGGATTLARRLGSGGGELPPPPETPVRIAVVLPLDDEGLGGEEEWEELEELLGPEENAGRIKLLRIDADSMTTLQQQLKGESFHVLHLIRHGAPDKLMFRADENSSGKDAVLSRRFAALLKDQPDLRLLVLNSCDGARSDTETSLPAMAAEMERRGIPSVVAMQFAISSTLAVSFAVRFYAALIEGKTVDEALAVCWRDLYSGSNHPAWGTPVLYGTRSGQRLFSKASWWNLRRKVKAAAAAALLLVLSWLAAAIPVEAQELRIFVDPFHSSEDPASPQYEVVLAKLQAVARDWPPEAGPPLRIVHSGCTSHGQGSWEEGGSKFYQLRHLPPRAFRSLRYGLMDGQCRTSALLEVEAGGASSLTRGTPGVHPADAFPLETQIVEWLLKGAGVDLSPAMRASIRSAVEAEVGDWTLRGSRRLDVRDYSDAARCFKEAIKKDSDFAPAYSYLALAESQLGQIESAAEHALAAVQLQPSNGLLRFNYGALLRRFFPDRAEEAKVQLKVAAEDYKYPDAWNELGALFLSEENWRKARQALEDGLAAKPGDPIMRKNLAWAELELGDLDSAMNRLKGIESALGDDLLPLLEATLLKARIHHRRGEFEEACLRLQILEQTDSGIESDWSMQGKKLEENMNCDNLPQGPPGLARRPARAPVVGEQP